MIDLGGVLEEEEVSETQENLSSVSVQTKFAFAFYDAFIVEGAVSRYKWAFKTKQNPTHKRELSQQHMNAHSGGGNGESSGSSTRLHLSTLELSLYIPDHSASVWIETHTTISPPPIN